MRIIGLDIGEKRIGVAITDKLNKISYPLVTISNDTNTKNRLLDIIRKHDVDRIIVGLPYSLNGKEGVQAGRIMEFVKENLSSVGIPVIYRDERFTTKISRSIMLEKKSGKKTLNIKDGEEDRIAASLILKDYLESNQL